MGGIYATTTLGFSLYENFILAIVLTFSAGIGSFVFGYLEDLIDWAKNRVAHSTKKNLLIAIVDEEAKVSYYEIRWIQP